MYWRSKGKDCPVNCHGISMSETGAWQDSGAATNTGRLKKTKRPQKGQFIFTGLSMIKTHVGEKVIFQVVFFPSSPATLSEQTPLGKNKADSRSSDNSCQSTT